MTIYNPPSVNNQIETVAIADCQLENPQAIDSALDNVSGTDNQIETALVPDNQPKLNRFNWWPDGLWPYILIAVFFLFIWLFYPLILLVGLVLVFFWFTL